MKTIDMCKCGGFADLKISISSSGLFNPYVKCRRCGKTADLLTYVDSFHKQEAEKDIIAIWNVYYAMA